MMIYIVICLEWAEAKEPLGRPLKKQELNQKLPLNYNFNTDLQQ